MLRGSKLNRQSTLFPTRTLWEDSFTFERYAKILYYLKCIQGFADHRNRIVRPNLDLPAHQQAAVAVMKATAHQEDEVVSEVVSEVAWALEVELEVEDVKFTSPTFVSIYIFPLYACGIENVDLVN